MPNTKISNLTTAAPLSGSEVAPIVQSGTTVKASTQDIANLALPSQTGNANKYLQTNGTTTSWDAVNISTADVTGTLPIANGGTGQTTAGNAINALLPSQAGNSNKYLTTDGVNPSWGTITAASFTFISYRFTVSSGFFNFTLLKNTTGSSITVVDLGNIINISTTNPTLFTTNRTYVTCSDIRTTTPDLAIAGGIEYSGTNTINIYFYTTAGANYSFTGKNSSFTGTFTIQIYP